MNANYLFNRFDGRIGRRTFWIAFLGLMVVEIVIFSLVSANFGRRPTAILDLALTYPEFAIFVKRANDRDLPVWIVAAFFVFSVLLDFLVVAGFAGAGENPSTLIQVLTLPWLVAGLALLIDLGFRRGTPGHNRHGPDPLQGNT
ncbi:MAG: DUF805 domain-containing protein [Proteobacteria bacterium]|nr:DUF805 domain-containing protein [Pseudomonadota bacterium]